MGLAVRITLGKPPHWFTYPYEEVRLLALPPRVVRLRDDRAFKGAYERHLEAVRVETLQRKFQNLSERHEGLCMPS
jgi:hypothetical protein